MYFRITDLLKDTCFNLFMPKNITSDVRTVKKCSSQSRARHGYRFSVPSRRRQCKPCARTQGRGTGSPRETCTFRATGDKATRATAAAAVAAATHRQIIHLAPPPGCERNAPCGSHSITIQKVPSQPYLQQRQVHAGAEKGVLRRVSVPVHKPVKRPTAKARRVRLRQGTSQPPSPHTRGENGQQGAAARKQRRDGRVDGGKQRVRAHIQGRGDAVTWKLRTGVGRGTRVNWNAV